MPFIIMKGIVLYDTKVKNYSLLGLFNLLFCLP